MTGQAHPAFDAGLTLDAYQARAAHTDVLPADDEDAYVLPLLGLVGEVGGISSELKKRRRDELGYRGFEDQLREELGDALWYLAVLAHRAGLPLSQVAAGNLAKADHAFGPAESIMHPGYDADRPEGERLPRQLTVHFSETTVERQSREVPTVVVQVVDQHNERLGDPIDDNSTYDDDYRFHDVFHLAHMAVLGWSPALRATLRPKRKRRSTHHDWTEDGARAVVLEEGLTAAVFAQAKEHSYFASTSRIPSDLLKLCRSLTASLEVSDRSTGEWQRALLEGYRTFAMLRTNRGGIVMADQDARTLTYRQY